ncbi:MAG TPA: poly-beta-1,6-N-acetyl-D-glucosamine biosynthesis protein PgaD [Stellaceae bacterium]|nr:poly-beta-1,6-N-acetyl-D-glucosamine biosynthesis protein PgaD [Stellaceae bacterium]
MDQSGPWIPVILPPDLIIEAPESLPLWTRARDWSLTTLMWIAYFWLISETFSYARVAFAWLILGEPLPEEVEHFAGILATLESYALVVVINAAILVSWALYNLSRFRGRERRKFSPTVTVQDLARFYDASASDIAAWQLARILVVHHNEAGGITAVETGARAAPPGEKTPKIEPEQKPPAAPATP